MAAFGQNRLMPTDPDCKCKVINGTNGYTRENTSWILGRITRDFEYWRDPKVAEKTEDILDGKWNELKRTNPNAKRQGHASLVISIYEPNTTIAAGTTKYDFVHWIGYFVIIVQLSIAAIPMGCFGNWSILIITIIGTILSFATVLLPQWKTEKWACRTHSNKTYIITRGNGAQNAIVILGNGHGFNLEDLASGQVNTHVAANTFTRVALSILFVFWILLLIVAAGIKQNTWFLLAVGGIGIVQNVYVAGYPRRPENFGIPLNFIRVIGHTKVMKTLMEAEKHYENLGRALLPEFFPGALTVHEEMEWKEIQKLHNLKRAKSKETQGVIKSKGGGN